ncbi:hypothetical protein EDD86DRAFT_71670 [Gorgonomyces haynaldii]|nr:hypothetical protein EDD86DRAFT_71670 [Gorgonomyces haynaldii]
MNLILYTLAFFQTTCILIALATSCYILFLYWKRPCPHLLSFFLINIIPAICFTGYGIHDIFFPKNQALDQLITICFSLNMLMSFMTMQHILKVFANNPTERLLTPTRFKRLKILTILFHFVALLPVYLPWSITLTNPSLSMYFVCGCILWYFWCIMYDVFHCWFTMNRLYEFKKRFYGKSKRLDKLYSECHSLIKMMLFVDLACFFIFLTGMIVFTTGDPNEGYMLLHLGQTNAGVHGLFVFLVTLRTKQMLREREDKTLPIKESDWAAPTDFHSDLPPLINHTNTYHESTSPVLLMSPERTYQSTQWQPPAAAVFQFSAISNV